MAECRHRSEPKHKQSRERRETGQGEPTYRIDTFGTLFEGCTYATYIMWNITGSGEESTGTEGDTTWQPEMSIRSANKKTCAYK